jgi:signal transduction histidine kinase
MTDLIQKINGTGTINASCRFNDYKRRLKLEPELSVFRIIQELINNVLKHSRASFLHLTQSKNEDYFYIRIHHDGEGLTQEKFEELRDVHSGLGLKNIQGRIKILGGKIFFEKDATNTYFKVTIELPADMVQ